MIVFQSEFSGPAICGDSICGDSIVVIDGQELILIG